MSEREQIQRRILEIASENGELATRLVLQYMQHMIDFDEELSYGGAVIYLRLLGNVARRLQEAPSTWVYLDRFSGALFDYHYRVNVVDGEQYRTLYELARYQNGIFRRFLHALDDFYGEQFSVVSALNFLQRVRDRVGLLQQEMKDKRDE